MQTKKKERIKICLSLLGRARESEREGERERARDRERTWTGEQNTEARGRQAGGAAVLEERDSDARSVGTSIVGHIHLEHLRPPPSGKTRFHADICDSHEAGQR